MELRLLFIIVLILPFRRAANTELFRLLLLPTPRKLVLLPSGYLDWTIPEESMLKTRGLVLCWRSPFSSYVSPWIAGILDAWNCIELHHAIFGFDGLIRCPTTIRDFTGTTVCYPSVLRCLSHRGPGPYAFMVAAHMHKHRILLYWVDRIDQALIQARW